MYGPDLEDTVDVVVAAERDDAAAEVAQQHSEATG